MAIVTDKVNSVRTTSFNDKGKNEAKIGQRPWQEEMRDAIRDVTELCRILNLPVEVAGSEAIQATAQFPLFVPLPFLSRIAPGNLDDPLLKQVLPVAGENGQIEGFKSDPVADQAAEKAPGLIQKYHGRVLLIAAKACAVHCRYCFRREFPYTLAPGSIEQWKPAIDWISKNDSVHEVILSGGDPLTLVDSKLAELIGQLERIAHVRRLRIHSRLPVMIPSRISDEFVALLSSTRLTTFFVVHSNHANEWDELAGTSIARLIDNGVPVLNQAVLLRGINDSVEALVNLSERLIDLRIMPYYLNQLDRVSGAAHFEVPVKTGKRLVSEIRGLLPGYAVPKYVVDDGNSEGKSLV